MKRKLWLPIALMLSFGLLAACQSAGEASKEENIFESGEAQDMREKNPEKMSQDLKTEEASSQVTSGEDAGETEQDLEEKADWEEVVVPEHEILLVSRRLNRAWGYQDQGYFIDTDGCVYSFDFGNSPVETKDGESLSFIERLEAIRESTECEPVFDMEFVKQISALGANLSADDEFEKISARCDYGQHTLFFYQPETKELFKCKSLGDYDYIPKNESAAKIAKLLEETIARMAREAPELY